MKVNGPSGHSHMAVVTATFSNGFIKGKSCLTNLIAFYDKITDSVDDFFCLILHL